MDNNNETLKNRYGLKLVFSILEILSCCLLNPITLFLGIVALIFTCNANASYKSGKTDEFKDWAKKSTIVLWVGLAFDIIIVIIWAVMAGNVSKAVKEKGYESVRDYYEAVINNEASEEEDSTEDLDLLEEEDFDYTLADADTLGEYWKFTLDGKSYEVPFTLSELADAGYVFDTEEPSTNVLQPQECYSETFYDPEGEIMLGSIELFNPSDEEKSELDCVITSFTIYDDLAYEGDYDQDLTVLKDLSFNSTMDETRAALGTPSYIDDSYDDVIYDEWILDDDFNDVLYIGYMNDKIAYVCIDYWGNYDSSEAYYDSDEDALELDEDDLVLDGDDIVIE